MSDTMKRRIGIFGAACLLAWGLCACRDTWESSVTLGVNATRINLTTYREAGSLVVPVYSNRTWEAAIAPGGEWLTADRSAGSGREYIHLDYEPNTGTGARVARLVLTGGERIEVVFVQSGSEQAASEIDDAELNDM